jgi:hypothetical protein
VENKIKRPISVWIAQIFFVLMALIYFAGPVVFVIVLPRSGELTFITKNMGVSGIIYMVTESLVYISLSITAFCGMAIRKPFGRWVGIATLSLSLIDGIVGNFRHPLSPIEQYERSSSSDVIALISISCLLLFVILNIAFARKVSAFFSQEPPHLTLNVPPPPPSFGA